MNDDVRTFIQNRHWTEDLIERYAAIIKMKESEIKSAEERISWLKKSLNSMVDMIYSGATREELIEYAISLRDASNAIK